MNYKLLASRAGCCVLSTGDTYTLSNSTPLPDLFDAELIDPLPLQADHRVVAVVPEPIYQLLIERQQITTERPETVNLTG